MAVHSEPRTRLAVIDGLRALAALTVLTLHTWYAAGQPVLDTPIGPFVTTLIAAGYTGVDFFFVISGFVLFLPVCLNGGRFGSVRVYALRRAARILPLYWLTLAVVVLALPVLTTDPWAFERVGTNVLLHLTFLQHTVGGVLHLQEGFQVNGVIWTLTVEAMFYALLPLIAHRFYRHPGRWFALFVGISAVWRFAATAWANPISQDGPIVYGLMLLAELPTYLPHFAMGMVAALLYVRLRSDDPPTHPGGRVPPEAHRGGRVGPKGRIETTTPRTALLLLLIGGFSLVWGMHELGLEDLFKTGGPYGHLTGTVPVTIAFAFVLIGLLLGPSWVRRPFHDVVLRKLGEISYGIYLWHLIVIAFLRTNLTLPTGGSKPFVVWFGLALAATLVLAWLSHVAIERPAIRWARRRTSAAASADVGEPGDPEHPGGTHGAYVAFAVYVLFMAVLLMSPHPLENVLGVNLGDKQHWAEEIGNVLIFVPIGWIAAHRLPTRWRALALGFGIACAAEFIQWAFLPGRTPSFDDIVKNTVGTGIGVLLSLLRTRRPQSG